MQLVKKDRMETEKVEVEAPASVAESNDKTSVSRWAVYGLGGLLGLIVLYYLLGAIYLYRIDDDPAYFETIEVPENGSTVVAVAAALIDREVNQNRWLANDPFFIPSYLLDNTPNYQRGIIAALSRFGIELTDHIARIRGSSQIDRNAEDAAGQLKYPGDVWFLEWSSTPVQPSSESQYRNALENLREYNARLGRGEAVFETRGDNLLATLDRIASDIGSSSAALFQHIDTHSGALYDHRADDLFYENKGRLYGYWLLLSGLSVDYANIIDNRELASVWNKMLQSLEAAAMLEPFVVANGGLDAQLVPNHLAAQGFLLLRTRIQLREVTNILLK